MSGRGKFEVRVARVGETADKAGDFSVEVDTVQILPDGTLYLNWENGGQSLSPSCWGSFMVVRVPSTVERL